MRTRVLVLVLLALLLAGVGVWQWPCRSSAVAPPAPAAAIQSSDADTLFAWHAVHSFGEARAMLRDAYRLTPDRRFLLAVADVPRLAGDRAPGEVATRWDGARWVVTCGADSVGVLPGYPSYADARALLAPWAARWRSAGEANPPAAAGEAPSPVPDDLFTALVALDARWRGGERGAAVQAAGAEALGWLVLANAGDCTRQSDVLAGRMLAALSLANAAGTAMPRAHVLLARVCGYPHEAAALAATLPAGDPRRAWAQRDTAALTRLALAKGAGAEARLMHLYALAEDGRSDAWFGALMECFPPGRPGKRLAISTGQLLRTFESAEAMARWTAFATTLETQRWTRADTGAVIRALHGPDVPRSFERLLLEHGPRAGGPLLDAVVVRAHSRAQLYTALSEFGLHQVAGLFDESSSRAFGRRLGSPGDGPAGEFVRWYDDIVDGTWPGDGLAPPLAADLVALGTLGPEQLEMTYDLAAPRDVSWRPRLTRLMARRMDTRPRDRSWLAWTSIANEISLEGRDDLLAASAGEGGPGGEAAAMWLAGERGDDATLVRLLGSADVSVAAKTHMLRLLQEPTQPLARAQRGGAAACAANPEDPTLVLEWAKGLEQHGDPEHARRILENWLDHDWDDATGLGVGRVVAHVGRYYREAGMPLRAWAVLRQDSTGMFAVLSEQALTLDALGQPDAALKLALDTAERYHGEPGPSGDLAQLYWAHGRDSLAANALVPTLGDANYWRWTLGHEFVARFRGRPQAALAAVRAMEHRFGNRRAILQKLALAYGDAGDPATGLRIIEATLSAGLDRAFEVVDAYELARKSWGRERALAWLAAAPMPLGRVREVTHETGAAYGIDEMAWLDSLPASPKDRDWSLLVRAPATAAAPQGDPRRAQMHRELHAREGTYYLALARYVAEGGDVADVLKFADDLRHRIEVFFWIGRRAEIEGRQADAAACYQLCQETAQVHQGEWLWSRHRLLPLIEPLRTLREKVPGSRDPQHAD